MESNEERCGQWRGWACAAVIGALLMAAGCQAPPPPAPPPPPPAVWQPPADRAAQVSELSGRVARFHDLVSQLPAPTGADHRRIASMAMGELSKILRLAEGSGEPYGFDNTVGVVSSAAATMGASELSTERSRTAESEGIRAAFDALGQVQDTRLRDDPELVRMLSEAQASLDSLYASTGPFHDDAADQALRMIDGITRRIDADFKEMMGGRRAR